MYYSHIWDS